MPVQQARMELAEGTEAALAGQIEAQVKEDTLRLLEPTLCLLCIGHTFGRAVMINAPCQHHFHRRCIDPVLEGDGTACPCRTPLRPEGERVVEARRHKQMMDGLLVKCPQCEELLRFEQLDGHVRNPDGCPNTPFRCGNEGCGALFLRKDKEEHLNTCPHRIVTCGQCNAPIKSGELQQHEREQCPRRKVRCPHCQKEYISNEKAEHERECTGSVPMKSLTELREMIIQQQQAFEQQVGQLREQAAQQQQTIERQGQTIERQQREIAELRDLTEDQRRERAALPQRLTVRGSCTSGWDGEYSLRPERVNGAAVWGKGDCRLYRSREGHWGLIDEADGPQRNRGFFRLTSQPGSPAPLNAGGWEYCSGHHWDMSRADGWEPSPYISVAAA